MGYIYDNVTGRIAAVVHQGTPTPPAGFSLSNDVIQDADLLSKKRDIGTGLLVNRDRLAISGTPGVPAGTVGQIVVQKYDGTTGAPKTDPSDTDAVSYALESTLAFMNKASGTLAAGADAVKIAAPVTQEDARFLVFSPELQLLDTMVSFD